MGNNRRPRIVWRWRFADKVEVEDLQPVSRGRVWYHESLQGPGSCDHNTADRALNLVTSLPFFAVAWHTCRHRKSKQGQLWGASMAGVGAGSIVFHSTWGRIDYWAIALSSMAMTRAVYPLANKTPSATATSLCLTPFQPLVVSSANAIAMEAEFWRRANHNPELRRAQRLHLAAGALGAICFVLEEKYPHWPLIHTIWHGLSAVGVATTNNLMADVEAQPHRRPPRIMEGKDPVVRADECAEN